MKKIIIAIFFLATLFLPGTLLAQNPGAQAPIRGRVMERLKEAKWAFLIYRLHLDEQRANKLLPVYEAFEAEKRAIFRGKGRQILQDNKEMTDEQAEEVMNNKLETARKLLALKEKYKVEFLKVLSPSELLELQRAEQDFALKLQMERQKRRKARN